MGGEFPPLRGVTVAMPHEIAHESTGSEDVHPLAFWELLGGTKAEYRAKLAAGEG